MPSKRKSCEQKKYLTIDEAYSASRRLWKERQVMPYKCSFCSGWHVGRHKNKRLDFLFDLIAASHA